MNYETAVNLVPFVFLGAGLVTFLAGYFLGEQAAYRSIGYGSERAFSSFRQFLTRRR